MAWFRTRSHNTRRLTRRSLICQDAYSRPLRAEPLEDRRLLAANYGFSIGAG